MNPYFSPNNVLVAELAECVYGFPLMDQCPRIGIKGILVPPYSWYANLFETEKKWLQQLEECPEALEQMVSELEVDIPIGKRFEAFIRFWLEHGPGFDLLASNVQVFRDGRTLGEFDFLCRDLNSGKFIHIEAACKYYLGYTNSTAWEHWAGPNSEDRLSDKMKKFAWQFALEEIPEGSAALRHLGIASCHRLLFLKGMFFHHISSISRHKSPLCSGSHYRSGWFLNENELELLFPGGESWILPDRQHWLRSYHTGSPEKEGENTLCGRSLTLSRIRQKIRQTGKAVMACRVEEFGNLLREESRGFILPGIALNPEARKLS